MLEFPIALARPALLPRYREAQRREAVTMRARARLPKLGLVAGGGGEPDALREESSHDWWRGADSRYDNESQVPYPTT